MADINVAVKKLAAYGLATGLIEKEDIIYTVNSILIVLGLDNTDAEIAEIEKLSAEVPTDEAELGCYLEKVLGELDDYAAATGLIENDSVV